MIPHGKGSLANFILAMEWAALQGDVSIINMSAGKRGFVEGMEQAVEDLLSVGILPVIAIGNEGEGASRSPGNYDPVLSVGASDKQGKIWDGSSSGTYKVKGSDYNVPDLVAPGKAVTSCNIFGGGLIAKKGTSMATPIVSGVAALIFEKNPDITVLDLQNLLLDTCKDLQAVPVRQGAGLVQVDPTKW
jgi:subtilisin family serine protease